MSQHRRQTTHGKIQFYPIGLIGSSEDSEKIRTKHLYTLHAIHGILDQHIRVYISLFFITFFLFQHFTSIEHYIIVYNLYKNG